MNRVFNIASYKRHEQLIKTVESIFYQADIINIALNCYDEIPQQLYDNKIKIYHTDNSLGDAFKFIALPVSNGYFFSCDDDLIYPKDYSEFMIEAVERYNRKSIISLHGRSFNKFPVLSYYRGATTRVYCLRELNKDIDIQFGGTGVMCFHTDLMKIPIDYFKYPNMADVFIGKYAKENNIKSICAAHKEGFVKQQLTETNIYKTTCKNDIIQTKIINDLFGYGMKEQKKPVYKKETGTQFIINSKKFGKVGEKIYVDAGMIEFLLKNNYVRKIQEKN